MGVNGSGIGGAWIFAEAEMIFLWLAVAAMLSYCCMACGLIDRTQHP